MCGNIASVCLVSWYRLVVRPTKPPQLVFLREERFIDAPAAENNNKWGTCEPTRMDRSETEITQLNAHHKAGSTQFHAGAVPHHALCHAVTEVGIDLASITDNTLVRLLGPHHMVSCVRNAYGCFRKRRLTHGVPDGAAMCLVATKLM
eukprot:607438-Amphidinium_carterae.4